MFSTIKLQNFVDIKKPQLVKVEAFVHFFKVWVGFCNTLKYIRKF